MGRHQHRRSSSSDVLVVTPFETFGEVLAACRAMPQDFFFDLRNPDATGEILLFPERLEKTVLDGFPTIWSFIEHAQDITPESKVEHIERLLNACNLHGEAFREYGDVLPALLELNEKCTLARRRYLTDFRLEAAHHSFRLRFQALQSKRVEKYEAYVNRHYQKPHNDHILALIEGVMDDGKHFDGLFLTLADTEAERKEIFRALRDTPSSLSSARHSSSRSSSLGPRSEGLKPDSDDSDDSDVPPYDPYDPYDDYHGYVDPEQTFEGIGQGNKERFVDSYKEEWRRDIDRILSEVDADVQEQRLIEFFAVRESTNDDTILDSLISPFREMYNRTSEELELLKQRLKQWQQNFAFINGFPKKNRQAIYDIISQDRSTDERDQYLIRFIANHPFSNISNKNFISLFKTHYNYDDEKCRRLGKLLKKIQRDQAFIALFGSSHQEKVASIISAAPNESERDQLVIELMAQIGKKNDRRSLENKISRFVVFYGDNTEKLKALQQNLEQWQRHIAFIRCFPKDLKRQVYSKIKEFDSEIFKENVIKKAKIKLSKDKETVRTPEETDEYLTTSEVKEPIIQEAREQAIIEFVLANTSVADAWPLLEQAFSQYGYQENDFERLREALSQRLLEHGISVNQGFREAVEIEAFNQCYLFPLYKQLKEAIYMGFLANKVERDNVRQFFQGLLSDTNLKLYRLSESVDTNQLIVVVERLQVFFRQKNITLAANEVEYYKNTASFKEGMKNFYQQEFARFVDPVFKRAKAKRSYVRDEAKKIWDLYRQKSAVSVDPSITVDASSAVADNGSRENETTSSSSSSSSSSSASSTGQSLMVGTSEPVAEICPSITRLQNLDIQAECARTRAELATMYTELEAKNAVEFIYNTIMQHSWRVGLLGKVKDLFGVSYKIEEDFHMPGRSQRASKLSRHQQQMIDLLEPFFRPEQNRLLLTQRSTRVVPDSWVSVLEQLQVINGEAKNQHSRLRSRQMQNFYNSTARQLAAIDSLSRANTSDVSPPASSSSPSNLGLPPISSAPAEVSGPLPAPSASSVDSQSPDPMSTDSAASPDSVGSSSPPEGSKHRRTQSLSSVTSAPAESTPSNSLFGSSLIFSNPNVSSNAPTTSATEVTSPSKSGHHRTKSG